MKKKPALHLALRKNACSPVESGGGGIYFENMAQAFFATLMFVDGRLTIFPNAKIDKIDLQTHRRKLDPCLDDCNLFLSETNGCRRRIYAQMKRFVNITTSNKEFVDTVTAAWIDFNLKDYFTSDRDALMLVTGPFSHKDIDTLTWIVDQARNKECEGFFHYLECGEGFSKHKRTVFDLIRKIIEKASGTAIANDAFYKFLQSFYVLQPDLWYQHGSVESLLLSLLRSAGYKKTARIALNQIIQCVIECNKSGGTLSSEYLHNVLSANSIEMDNCDISVVNTIGTLAMPSDAMGHASNATIQQRHLALLALVGTWDDACDGDNKVLYKLFQLSDADFANLKSYVVMGGAPIATISNGKAAVVNRMDLFTHNANALLTGDIKCFVQLCSELLSTVDGRLQVPAHERTYAEMLPMERQISEMLYAGLMEGVDLLGVYSHLCVSCSPDVRNTAAGDILRAIFKSDDWMIWATLDYRLPLLAEAAPDTFLSIVKRALSDRSQLFSRLFKEEHSYGIIGRSYITGLVRALGCIAWDGEHLGVSVKALAKLAEIDCGGQWVPRPLDVLKNMFFPLAPCTTAASENRIAIVKSIGRDHPDIMKELVESLLPLERYVYTANENKPKYRLIECKQETIAGTFADQWKQFDAYCRIYIAIAKDDIEALKRAIPKSQWWSPESRNEFLAMLRERSMHFEPEDKYSIFNMLRESVRYCDGDYRKQLSEVMPLYRVDDVEIDGRRYFNWDGLDEFEGLSSQEKRIAEERQQQKVVAGIISKSGVAGLLRFADSVSNKTAIGMALARMENTNDSILISELLPKVDCKNQNSAYWVLHGFVGFRYDKEGWLWCESVGLDGMGVEERLMLMWMLPFKQEVIGKVSAVLGCREKKYWKCAHVAAFDDGVDYNIVVKKLVGVGRLHRALSVAAQSQRCMNNKVTPKIALNVLKKLATERASDTGDSMMRHYLLDLLNLVQGADKIPLRDKVAIEFAWLEVLDGMGSQPSYPRSIWCALSQDINLFSELLSHAFLPDDYTGEKPVQKPEEQELSCRAWKILHGWKMPPGVSADGSFDYEKFRAWFSSALKNSDIIKRAKSFEHTVGNLFVFLPLGENGLPFDSRVLDMTEGDDFERIRNSYVSGKFNSRGVHVVDKSGEEDRILMKRYSDFAAVCENFGFINWAESFRRLVDMVKSMSEWEHGE